MLETSDNWTNHCNEELSNIYHSYKNNLSYLFGERWITSEVIRDIKTRALNYNLISKNPKCIV